jgi:pyridoxamine 5'-phosphate oxidase
LLKDADDKGFTFFTNYHSRKGAELDANPFASLLFFWPLLERQIRIEGKVEKTSQKISDQYFNSRPIESRIAAIVSPQSKVVASRDELDTLYNMYKRNHSTDAVERPAHWGGYRLIPDCFEFWQGRPNRLHDRIVYKWTGVDWVMERLGA